MKPAIKELLDGNGGKELPAWAWPGGYPIFYLDEANDVLCAKCATESVLASDEERCGPEVVAYDIFEVVAYDIFYEGPDMQCAQCYTTIESAFGDPDADES